MAFEILAFKFTKGKYPACLKVLKPRILYYLNSGYIISPRDVIKLKNPIPESFYHYKNPTVNISAIVGKNGSGKSSIIDMMLRLLNNLSKKFDKLSLDLEYVEGINASLYCKIENSFYKIHSIGNKVFIYKFNRKGQRLKKPLTGVQLKELFYTIIINYSHYAYNTQDYLEEGKWLDGLFHKNDGYQTPIVINPFRQNGNLEINNEHHLAKSRLISNFLKRNDLEDKVKFRIISENLEAYSLNLKLNRSKEEVKIYENYEKDKSSPSPVTLNDLNLERPALLMAVDKAYHFGYNQLDTKKYKIALDYIVYKLVSICTKYIDYFAFYDKKNHRFYNEKLEIFLKMLFSDTSHITFKLRQTLNFLKYRHLELKNQAITLDQLSNKIINIKKNHKGFIEYSHFVPPPIFSTEIMIKAKGVKRLISFTSLSSGEKQLFYSIASLLYHLKNLDSIRNSKRRIGYKYINVVLEEVELYFHPEMQRSYVNFILDCIDKMELRAIRSINIIFVTHSPFILSDIPDSKVLFLEQDGFPVSKIRAPKTFGGNIHDILADSFFLDKGFIGEFAKNKIQSTITELNDALKDNKKVSSEIYEFIELIGEPFLSLKLKEMYFRCNPDEASKLKRIQELEQELNRLKYD